MFHMKNGPSITSKVTVFLSSAVLVLSTACSSAQQDQEELDVSDEQYDQYNQENLGEDDAAEGNGQENYYDNNQQYDQYNQGADINNDTSNEFAYDNSEGFSNIMNPTLDNSASMPMTNSSAPMSSNSMAAPAPTYSDRAPVPGGRVRYVRGGGVQVVNSPGGAPIFTLETGDHPVTWEENGWLRLSTGMYVPVDAMSDRGVARPTHNKTWN